MAFSDEKKAKLMAWLGNRTNLEAAAAAFGIEEPQGDLDAFGRDLIAKIQRSLETSSHVQNSLATRLAEEAGVLPVFGMPTTQRSLFYLSERQLLKDRSRGRGEMQSIARDQETAIYEYQPGSTRTVDKSIYKSSRLVPPIRGWKRDDRRGVVPSFDERSEDFVGEWTHYLCVTCGVTNIGVPECQSCGAIIDLSKGFVGISPMAYATAGELPSERQRQASLGVVGAREILIDGQSIAGPLAGALNSPKLVRGATVWAINDNKGKLFKMRVARAPWLGLEHDPELPLGQGREIALNASKVTDVLAFWPQLEVPRQYRATNAWINPSKRSRVLSLEAAIYSAQFIIRRITSFQIDIDPEEIQVAKPNLGNVERPFFQGRFADALPNGSGICQWLVENWQDVLSAALDEDHRWAHSNPMAMTLHAQGHAGECGSACARCILEPRNHSFHFALDWRLGREALRLLRGSPQDLASIGAEQGDWADMRRNTLDVLLAFYRGSRRVDEGALELEDGMRYRLAHPLLPVEQRDAFRKAGDPVDTLFVDAWGAMRNPSSLEGASF